MEKDIVINAVKSLTEDGTFSIDRFVYDEKSFGNTLVVLKSEQLKIRFVKNRGECYCELWKNGENYFLEDVLEVIGLKLKNNSSDFIDFISKTSIFIKKELELILQAFDSNNWKKTQDKLKEIARKRVLARFGINLQ